MNDYVAMAGYCSILVAGEVKKNSLLFIVVIYHYSTEY
jgi:hypothetical protein